MSSGVHIFFGNGILPDPPVFEWPWPEIWIDGIEVTQAIQYYHSASHLTDSADQRKDNSARLIAGKAAWARVYVRTSKRYREIPGVTGTLTWTADWGSGIPLQGPWQLAAQPPGTVTARSNPPYATERGTLSYTLNFIIPAQLMFGWVFLDARVQTPSGANYTMSTSLDVGWRQTLWLGGIMVGYNGPANMAPNALNLTLPAPRSTICRIRLGKRC